VSEELPPRGTGIITGRAGERRLGKPRTEEEREERHSASPFPFPFPLTLNPNNVMAVEDILPALPPDPPLPRFIVRRLRVSRAETTVEYDDARIKRVTTEYKSGEVEER